MLSPSSGLKMEEARIKIISCILYLYMYGLLRLDLTILYQLHRLYSAEWMDYYEQFGRRWKEAVTAYFKVLSRHYSEGTEENHAKSVRMYSVQLQI
jgi:hypothetical protein